ncbi:MAG: DNA primase [bacterium]
MIKPEIVERVRQETDIVALIGSYLPLKKVGRYYRGLCPFHTERTPSFYVSPERQAFHCFGCGAGGTAITFVMRYERLEFPEAVRLLARRLGIKVEEEGAGGKYQLLYDVCEKAARFYEQMLLKSEVARNYLHQRGLTGNTIKRFRLGFAPAGNYLRGQAGRMGLNDEVLVKAGLVISRDAGLVDYFRERIIFPIFSLTGKVIGFGGRVLDDSEPKYLNSPDTPIFHKGENLYGMFQAKAYIREEIPLLVEGNFDLLALAEQGINNCIASLGTALTSGQALLIRRFNQQVVVCYDGDDAGRKACRRSIETLLRAGVDPQVVMLPAGEDPDSFIRKQGKAGFVKLLAGKIDFVDFILRESKMESVMEQRVAVKALVELVKLIPDDVTRELYRNRIAQIFHINPDRLGTGGVETPVKAGVGPLDRESRRAEQLLAAAVQNRELARIVREYSLSELITQDELKQIAEKVEASCDDDNYSPSRLMELVEDEGARDRIAGWLFREEQGPSIDEFRRQVCRFRAQWLQHQIEQAYRQGDYKRVEMLTREKNWLRQKNISEKGVRCNEK